MSPSTCQQTANTDTFLSDGELVNSDIRTTPFYAYSHKKVLTRRRKIITKGMSLCFPLIPDVAENVSLRAISNNWGNISGGQEMHIVGVPFVKGLVLCHTFSMIWLMCIPSGPSLKVLFETPDGTVELKYADGQIERYSESVGVHSDWRDEISSSLISLLSQVIFFTCPRYPGLDRNKYALLQMHVALGLTCLFRYI